jgi:hypothetical protein
MSLIHSELFLEVYYNVIDIILDEIFELDIFYVKKPVKTLYGIIHTCRDFYRYFRIMFAKRFYKKFDLNEELFPLNCIRKNCKVDGIVGINGFGEEEAEYCGSIWDLLNSYKNDHIQYEEYIDDQPFVTYECRMNYSKFKYKDPDYSAIYVLRYYEKLFDVKLFFYKIHDYHEFYKIHNHEDYYKDNKRYTIESNIYSIESVLKYMNNPTQEILNNLEILYSIYSKVKHHLSLKYKIIYIFLYNDLDIDICYFEWKHLHLCLKYYLLKNLKE